MEDSIVEALQQILDVNVASEKGDFAKALFKQVWYNSEEAVDHIRDLSALLPPTLTLYHLSQRVPAVLLPKNRAALEIGKCTCEDAYQSCEENVCQAWNAQGHSIRRCIFLGRHFHWVTQYCAFFWFRGGRCASGLCHVELMEDVLRLGSAFLSIQKCLPETDTMTTASFKQILEDVCRGHSVFVAYSTFAVR